MSIHATKEAVAYIHIPFCIEQGPCVAPGSIVAGSSLKHSYMDALRQEIEGSLPLLEEYSIPAIYVGGGSPSIMSPDDICSLLQFVRKKLPLAQNFELSMEVLPQTVGTPSLEGMKAGGVNRVCLTMGSAVNEELSLLKCGFSLEDFDLSMNHIAQFAFRNLDLKIYYGFPTQTERTLRRTLQVARAFNPSHITLCDLSAQNCWEPSKEAERPQKPVPDACKATASAECPPNIQAGHLSLADRMLEEAGLRRYADGRYARPGRESRYVLSKYSGSDVIGFGVGARSLTGSLVCTNTTDLALYIENAAFYDKIVGRIEQLSLDQKQEYLSAMRGRLAPSQ